MNGMFFVAICYVSLGLLPVFWKLMAAIDSLYILYIRILWSLVFAGGYLACSRRLYLVRAAFHNRKAMAMSA